MLKQQNLMEHIRRNIKVLNYRDNDGTAVFALIYRLSSTAYVFLRSPSSMALMHVADRYPIVLGYAHNKEQFAEVIYKHLTV